ncbi:DUF3054 domain-containing protein [Agromyces archimandritae]|uniref:DUF3054 domain-containing protein n=1 Tax=Agromyces archimandritae TaxID=2781962 RepID=UPI003140580F
MTSAAPRHPSPRTTLLAFAADLVLVVVFVLIGRATHDENPVIGALTTLWPFAVALVVGWAVGLAWRAPLAPLRTGVPLWVVTVAGGMLLRAVSGQGTALPFVIVATVTLGSSSSGGAASPHSSPGDARGSRAGARSVRTRRHGDHAPAAARGCPGIRRRRVDAGPPASTPALVSRPSPYRRARRGRANGSGG